MATRGLSMSVVIGASLLIAAGCGDCGLNNGAVPMAFTRFEDQATALPGRIHEPRLVVAGNDPQAQVIKDLLQLPAASDEQLFDAFDFTNAVTVLVARGEFSSAGYTLEVSDIYAEGGKVVMVAEVSDPPVDGGAAAVMTYPIELLRVSLENVNLPAGERWEVVTADGSLLAEATYPP